MPAASQLHAPGSFAALVKVDLDYSDDAAGTKEAGLGLGTYHNIVALVVDGSLGRMRADGYSVSSDGELGQLEWQVVASMRAQAVQRFMPPLSRRGVSSPRSCTTSPLSPWESSIIRSAVLSGRANVEQVNVVSAEDSFHCFDLGEDAETKSQAKASMSHACTMLETLALRLVVPSGLPLQSELNGREAFYEAWLRPSEHSDGTPKLQGGEPNLFDANFAIDLHLVGLPPGLQGKNSSQTDPRASTSKSGTIGGDYAGPCLLWLHQTGPTDWSRSPIASTEHNSAAGVHPIDDKHPHDVDEDEDRHEAAPVLLPAWPGATSNGHSKEQQTTHQHGLSCLGVAMVGMGGRVNATLIEGVTLPADWWQSRRQAVNDGSGDGDPIDFSEDPCRLIADRGSDDGEGTQSQASRSLHGDPWLHQLCDSVGWRPFLMDGAWDLATLHGVHCEPVG